MRLFSRAAAAAFASVALSVAAFSVAAFSASGPAQAQAWPARPVRVIVAAAPGVPSDLLARGAVEPLGKALGQPIIVENRIGADGIIGTEACARAAPDGYALCGTASNVIVWNTVLRKDLPYDALKDLVPVMHGAFFDSALLVHPSVPARSVQQLIELAKGNPDKVNWGHFGVNSTGYMYEEWLKRSRQAPFYAVAYKTQPQVLQALLVNESNVAVYGLTNIENQVKGGKLRALAVTSSRRVEWMPDVPTFEEEGIKLPLRTWFGYHYPAATSRELVVRMNAELRKTMEAPSFRTGVMDRFGLIAATGTPEDFDAYIRNQIKQVAELVNYIGLKAE